MDILNYPHMLTDWLFVVAIFFIWTITKKGRPYRRSNEALLYQFLTVTGFSTVVISLGFYNDLYYYIIKMIIYFVAFHFITLTGDRIQGNVSKWIGSFHFGVIFGVSIGYFDLESVRELYSSVMLCLMTLQLILAFRGWLYGEYLWINNRLNHVARWHGRDVGHKP